MTKFYTAKYDRVFKTILCDEDKPYMMQEFLSRLLKRRIKNLKFLRNELPIRNTNEKVKTIDALVKDNNTYMHIELNTYYKNWLHARNYIYFSVVFTKKVKRGKYYDTKSKFIHIDLTYGLGKNKKEYEKYYVMNKEGKKYLENVEIIEYNMDKIMEYWYNHNEKKIKEYKHLIMLDLKKEELEKISKGDKFMEEFEYEINKLNEDETFQSAMTYEEDQELILNTEKMIAENRGIKKGKREGKKESIISVVKNMLSENIDINVISKVTGLPINKIKSYM